MNALVPVDTNSAFQLANMMATGKLVPAHLQRSPGDCLMVIEQAMRWGMSPFAVAQCTSVIQGKLMFEGKLVAAALQSCGILAGRLLYDFDGEGDTRRVTVSAVIKGETEPRTITLAFKDAKTSNGMWTKQTDQQLVYAGTRVWGRRHAPEVMLGVYAPEEMEAAPAGPAFSGTTIQHDAAPANGTRDDINAAVPLQTAAVATTQAAAQDGETVPPPASPSDSALAARKWVDGIKARITETETEDALHDLRGDGVIQRALDRLKDKFPPLEAEVTEAFASRFNDFVLGPFALSGEPAA